MAAYLEIGKTRKKNGDKPTPESYRPTGEDLKPGEVDANGFSPLSDLIKQLGGEGAF